MTNSAQHQLSPSILKEHSLASVANARDLLKEAQILSQYMHFSRSYFLAVASIEEAGKAFLSFEGQARNLSDPAVVTSLIQAMRDHRNKIVAAFLALIGVDSTAPEVFKEQVELMLELMIDVKFGREPSLYTDLSPDLSEVQTPATIVNEKAASDCIRLAERCLIHVTNHIKKDTPRTISRSEDAVFTMKRRRLEQLMTDQSLWQYYFEKCKGGRSNFADAVQNFQKSRSDDPKA